MQEALTRHRKSETVQKEQNETGRKSPMFPPIHQGIAAAPSESGRSGEINESHLDLKRKKSKSNIHCKVLLRKNGNFPFIGSNVLDAKR